MKNPALPVCISVLFCAFAPTASADGWVENSPCAARDHELADSSPDGTASNDDSKARLSVTVDSRGGSDISLEFGDPPVQHHTWGSGGRAYEGRENTCLPQRHRRLGPP